MEDIWSKQYAIRHYEVDSRGQLAVPFACRMLQEAAGCHARDLGLDMEALRPHGLTWVLSKFHIKFDEAALKGKWPGWDDSVTVSTWRAGLDRFFALRDYRLVDSAGRELAVATSFWALFDIEKRSLATIPAFITDNYPLSAPRSLADKFERIPRPTRIDHERRFQVNQSDLDWNNHTNNVSYISWAVDTVPAAVWSGARLAEMDVLYRLETVLDDSIQSMAQQDAEAGAILFNHQLKRGSDGKDVAQLRTRWIS